MIKVIMFDFDGVLAESVDVKTRAFTKLFKHEKKEHLNAIIDYHLKHGGVSRFEKINYFHHKILKKPLSDGRLKKLCDDFSNLVVDEVVNASWVRGAKEFLEEYHRKYACYVVSGTPQDEMREIIKRRHMEKYFRRVLGSPRKKPALIKEILERENCLPKEAVFIGDTITDYEAATECNVSYIGRVDSVNFQKGQWTLRDLTTLHKIIKKIDQY